MRSMRDGGDVLVPSKKKSAENMKQHSCALQKIHFSLLKVMDDNIAVVTM